MKKLKAAIEALEDLEVLAESPAAHGVEILKQLQRAFDGEDLDAVGHGRLPDSIGRAGAVCRTLADILSDQSDS